jgi:isoleucyl-tRNA synthetase
LPEPVWRDDALAANWDRLLAVRAAVTKALEEARQSGLIGHSLDARVLLHAQDGLSGLLAQHGGELPALFIVSQVELTGHLGPDASSPLLPELQLRVERARGGKCERCWNYSEAVGRDATHPGLCDRCLQIIQALAA